MRRYSEAVKADVRRRVSPPHRQDEARTLEELGNPNVITLYKWRKTRRLQVGEVQASQKAPEGWSAADKFTVVLENAGLNGTEQSGYCLE